MKIFAPFLSIAALAGAGFIWFAPSSWVQFPRQDAAAQENAASETPGGDSVRGRNPALPGATPAGVPGLTPTPVPTPAPVLQSKGLMGDHSLMGGTPNPSPKNRHH